MTIHLLGGRPEDKDHAAYDDETGQLERRKGLAPLDDLRGGFTELSDGDFWGVFRRDDDSKVYFRNNRMYPDDPDRFLVFVNILGPTQARVHYVLDGEIVEQAVYTRVTGVGVNPFDAFEEDVDKLMFFSKQHEPRRVKWPDLFAHEL